MCLWSAVPGPVYLCCSCSCGLLCLGLWYLSIMRLFVNFACMPGWDSDQPVQPHSLIWVFTVNSMDNWEPNLYAIGEDFYLAAHMRGLNLVLACCILACCANCCAPDNLLFCTLPLFFVWSISRCAPHHIKFWCAMLSMSIVYYILKKPWWRNVDVNTW